MYYFWSPQCNKVKWTASKWLQKMFIDCPLSHHCLSTIYLALAQLINIVLNSNCSLNVSAHTVQFKIKIKPTCGLFFLCSQSSNKSFQHKRNQNVQRSRTMSHTLTWFLMDPRRAQTLQTALFALGASYKKAEMDNYTVTDPGKMC